MGLLSKLLGRSAPVPEWADFLTAQEYAAFEEHLKHALATRSLPGNAKSLRSGGVTVRVGDEDASLGFGPIARKCRAIDQSDWPHLIAEHLDRALNPHSDLIARLGAEFEAARPYLRVQLVPDGFVRPDWQEELNFRTFGTGIKAALVYDLPTMVHSVPAADVGRWGRSGSELFDTASENVRADPEAPDIEHLDIDGASVSLEQLVGDSFFVCSHALWLDRYSEAASDRGNLLAVPSRHTVLFHPIRDASAWRALRTLPTMAADLHSKLPGPVSPNIFWLKDGRVMDIPVRDSGGQLQVMPPAELTNVMGELPED